MLLVPAVALTVLGIAIWVAGLQLGYKGIAVLGAVFVVGVGVTVLTTGLEQRAGTIEHAVNSSTTDISVQTTPVTFISSFNTGLIWSLLGAVMTLQGLNFKT